MICHDLTCCSIATSLLNSSDQLSSLSIILVSALYCIALYCTALHCSALPLSLYFPYFIDTDKLFVTWHLLEHPDEKPSASPEAREMHSTCCQYGNMLIIGGRNERGEILSDVWVLSSKRNSSSIQHGAEGSNGRQAPVLVPAAATEERESAHPGDPEVNGTDPTKDSLEIAEVLNESESSLIQCGALHSGSAGGGEFRGIIQELNLTAKEQKWQKTVTAITSPPASASIPSLSGNQNQMFWTILDNLKLPVGRCAHSAVVSGGDVFVCGGFSEGGITDVILQRALSLPLNIIPAESSDSKALHSAELELVLKEEGSGGAAWCPIMFETVPPVPTALANPIEGRFGHCMCAVSDPLLGHIHRAAHSRSSKQDSHPQGASIDDSNKLNQASRSAFLIFGGVSAEQDFGDIWIVTGARRDSEF